MAKGDAGDALKVFALRTRALGDKQIMRHLRHPSAYMQVNGLGGES
jgi:hypothetical protein